MNRKEFIQSTFLATFAATIPISALAQIFDIDPPKPKTNYPDTDGDGIFIFDQQNKLLVESQLGSITSEPVWDFLPMGDNIFQPVTERKLRYMETEITMNEAKTYIPPNKLLDTEMLKIVMAKDGIRFIAEIYITEVSFPTNKMPLVKVQAKVSGAIITIIDDLI